MTLTKTVQSLAHDAAGTASDLGSQAAELGSKAAEFGSDAASSVASAATNLAHSIGKKVPGVQPKRKSAPWRLIILIGAAIGGAFVFSRSRRSSPVATPAPYRETTPRATTPASTESAATESATEPTAAGDPA